jgi:hypothetical protein
MHVALRAMAQTPKHTAQLPARGKHWAAAPRARDRPCLHLAPLRIPLPVAKGQETRRAGDNAPGEASLGTSRDPESFSPARAPPQAPCSAQPQACRHAMQQRTCARHVTCCNKSFLRIHASFRRLLAARLGSLVAREPAGSCVPVSRSPPWPRLSCSSPPLCLMQACPFGGARGKRSRMLTAWHGKSMLAASCASRGTSLLHMARLYSSAQCRET